MAILKSNLGLVHTNPDKLKPNTWYLRQHDSDLDSHIDTNTLLAIDFSSPELLGLLSPSFQDHMKKDWNEFTIPGFSRPHEFTKPVGSKKDTLESSFRIHRFRVHRRPISYKKVFGFKRISGP